MRREIKVVKQGLKEETKIQYWRLFLMAALGIFSSVMLIILWLIYIMWKQ